MRENKYQAQLILKLKSLFPGIIVLKNDAGYIQGIPDLILLYGNTWAALEVKQSATASRQPNQEFYIEEMDAMSFASFIYPSNEEETLNALQQAFQP